MSKEEKGKLRRKEMPEVSLRSISCLFDSQPGVLFSTSGGCIFFFLSACAKVNMYSGSEPVSAVKLPGDKHASKILCKHPALRVLNHQLVHGFICMFVLLLFSAHPTSICAKITLLCWKVKCCLRITILHWYFKTTTVFWDKWHSKRF